MANNTKHNYSSAWHLRTSFILMSCLNKSLKNEIYTSNKRLLSQVHIFTEMYLIEKIKTLVIEKSLNTSYDISVTLQCLLSGIVRLRHAPRAVIYSISPRLSFRYVIHIIASRIIKLQFIICIETNGFNVL